MEEEDAALWRAVVIPYIQNIVPYVLSAREVEREEGRCCVLCTIAG